MKKLSILLSLLALNGCSYFDNVWSCIQHLDTDGDGKYDYLEFREYDLTNGFMSQYSTYSESIYSERDGKTDLDNQLYQALLKSDLEDIFDDPFIYGQLNKIEEDSLYIKYEVNDRFGGIRVGMEPIIKNQPNSERGSMHESFKCKKTRVNDFFMESHFPDTFNFEL